MHQAMSAHRDDFGAAGATVLNAAAIDGLEGAGSVADVDAVARAAERDLAEAARNCSRDMFRRASDSPDDWPDRLAAALAADPDLAITGGPTGGPRSRHR